MTKTMRVATVKATGERYLVQRMSFGSGEAQVYCWGEVLSVKSSRATKDQNVLALSASTTHGNSKTFMRSAVDISDDMVVTYKMALELLAQAQRTLGGVVCRGKH